MKRKIPKKLDKNPKLAKKKWSTKGMLVITDETIGNGFYLAGKITDGFIGNYQHPIDNEISTIFGVLQVT